MCRAIGRVRTRTTLLLSTRRAITLTITVVGGVPIGTIPDAGRADSLGRVTVLVDPPRWPAHGRLWSHLVSDRSYEELHEFAAAVGVPERAFDRDHYDIPQERYDDVVAAGAQPVEGKELIRRLIASGLRRPKRHPGAG